MAEFLHILAEQYDYPQLTDEVLRYHILFALKWKLIALTISFRDLSSKEFNNNDTRGPKSVSTFIAKLSELAPRLVIKQMTLLVKQLDSEVSHFIGTNKQADAQSKRPIPFVALSSRLAVI